MSDRVYCADSLIPKIPVRKERLGQIVRLGEVVKGELFTRCPFGMNERHPHSFSAIETAIKTAYRTAYAEEIRFFFGEIA